MTPRAPYFLRHGEEVSRRVDLVGSLGLLALFVKFFCSFLVLVSLTIGFELFPFQV
jgi:hypothetical protein